jgi:type IV pilus assembly protein PilC
VIQASDEAQARARLRQQGMRVARLRRAERAADLDNGPAPAANPATARTRGRISAKQIALFTRQLATMLRAGLPLLQSLDIAIRGAGQSALATLLDDVRQAVARGESLHAALARHPRQFDALFCNLVRAAEEAGMLDSMLERIALYREKSLALRGKVRAALAYPCAVVLVAIIVTVVIMLWVVPAFEQMFQQFGAELPLPTRIVMATARLLAQHGPWLLLGTLVTGVFPDLAVQMTAVGEEAGALDAMLSRIADLNEREVDEAVTALTSLMEPVIMAVLGVVIGGLVVAMYLPVFRIGAVV